MKREAHIAAGILSIATALAACSPKEVDQQAQQAWQMSVDAKQPFIAIIGNAPPPIVSNQLIDVIPVTYTVSDPGAVVDVRVNGGKPVILPNMDGEGKVAYVNVGSEGTHTLTISAKHCETSKEFGYHCSPEAFYQATIISDFTPPGAQVESLSIMPDGKIQVNYRLVDTNAQFGGKIKSGNQTAQFTGDGRATLLFDFDRNTLQQLKVEICDGVNNCAKETFAETLQDNIPPTLTLLQEQVIEGNRVLTYQVSDNWQELLPLGGLVAVNGENVSITSPNGVVTFREKAQVGNTNVTVSARDFAGNTGASEHSFMYNPFPTSVEMIQIDNSGTVKFRVAVNTTGNNFPAENMTVDSTQKTGNVVLDSLPLLNKVFCADPVVDAQHIDITCKPLTPVGTFQFTLSGEAAGGESWRSQETFQLNVPNVNSSLLTWYILRTGIAYASMVGAMGIAGTATARRLQEVKRAKRVTEYKNRVIEQGRPIEEFMQFHDKPNRGDILVTFAKQLIHKEKKHTAHRLSKTERQTYELIEKVWTHEYKRGDIYGAIIKLKCIDPFGYPSLEKLKYEMIGLLLSQVVQEFEVISQHKYTEALMSHRVKQIKHLAKVLSKEKGYAKIPEDVRLKLERYISEFDLVLRARSVSSSTELLQSKELTQSNSQEKDLVRIFNALINWNNIVIAHDLVKHVNNEKNKAYMRTTLKRTISALRSEFLNELRHIDSDNLTSKSGQKNILRKYLQDMRLPRKMLEEFTALLNLEVSRRNHDYVSMIRSFDVLVKADQNLPLDETFVRTVEDAVMMINTDIEPYFEAKSIARLSTEMGTKLLSFYAYLQTLQQTTWWDAVRFDKKQEIEQKVEELAYVIASGRRGMFERMRPEIFTKGDEKEIGRIITLNVSWNNFAGVSNLLESTKEKNPSVVNSLITSFHDNYWVPHVKKIVDLLQVENIQSAQELAQTSVYDFTQGVEVNGLLQNHKEYMYWKLNLLPHWPNLSVFPFPEQTQNRIASEVLKLVLHNRLSFNIALKAIEKWYEFTTLNAYPTAIFHYVGVQREDIAKALSNGDITPVATALQKHLIRLSAYLQRVSSGERTVKNGDITAFYEISAANLQYNWTMPVIAWVRSMLKKTPVIRAEAVKPIPLSRDMERDKLAELAIHNIFATLVQDGLQGYDNAVRALKVEPVSQFIGSF